MTYPGDSVRFEIRGTGPGSEIWITGFWYFANGSVTDQPSLATLNDSVSADVATWWNAIKANCYAIYALTELRAYYYAGGTNTAEFAATHVFTASPGTQAGVGSPIDTSICISTRTSIVGRSHRGRMYTPCHTPIQPSSGLITSGTVTTYVNATQALFNAMGARAGYVTVISRKLGTGEPVTTISADLKPDVQRRRENRLTGGTPVVAAITF